MYRIVSTRGTGKTYRLLEEASKFDSAVIVCQNPRAMREKAHTWGFANLTFMPYEDYISYYCEEPVFIDEIENYLKVVAGRTLMGYTYTLED